MAGSNLFFASKSDEEEKLLTEDEPHPVGLLTEGEIQRLLSQEYGERNDPN